jgi:hypothetical protein
MLTAVHSPVGEVEPDDVVIQFTPANRDRSCVNMDIVYAQPGKKACMPE